MPRAEAATARRTAPSGDEDASPRDIARSALHAHLLRLLDEARRPASTEEQLCHATGAPEKDVADALADLEDEGAVVRMPRGRWASAGRSGMHTGRVKVERSGRALVILDVPDAPLVVERGALRPAMDGDRVLVEEQRFSRGGLRQARIHRVLERARTVVVGVASPIAKGQLLPSDERIGPYVIVLAPGSEPAPPGVAVAATIVEYPSSHRDLTVRVDRVLGKVGELATEIEAACILRGIDVAFGDDAEREAAAFTEPSEADLAGRADLRAALTVTCDPADAKDHDDAMSIEPREGGGWRVTVSIADVSWYVRPGTALDAEAYDRATSVYFPGRAIPMLPERLSGDLASLHPGVDRLAVSVFLDIDARGNVKDTSFARSVIHSSASLTYQQVQAVLDEEGFTAKTSHDEPLAAGQDDEAGAARPPGDAPATAAGDDAAGDAGDDEGAAVFRRVLAAAEAGRAAAAIRDDASRLAAPVREALVQMARCADALHGRRLRRGAIDMDLPEAVVELDDAGEVRTIHRRPRLFAHRLVEEFMLAANEAVAGRIDRSAGAFLYRIHERPDDDALAQLASRVKALGLRLEREGGLVEPMVFQRLLADAAGRPEARQVNMMVLRTMTRARYSADKEIHFGLASRCYTHFTSPIRRYPDIVAHRALLEELRREADARGHATAALPRFALPSREALGPAAAHTSDRERRAMDAERDVASAAGVLYMARHVGRLLAGTVSGVDRWGFWVELDVAYVEGFVHVGKLDEYFDYVAERMELQSRVSPAVIRIGQAVRVRVASVDLAARRIELDLAAPRRDDAQGGPAPRAGQRIPPRPDRERTSRRSARERPPGRRR